MPGLRLADCGDLLNVQQYSDFMLQSKNTTYQQIHSGAILVKPWTLKPAPRWRRTDIEEQLARRDLVIQQRQQRAKLRLAPRAS